MHSTVCQCNSFVLKKRVCSYHSLILDACVYPRPKNKLEQKYFFYLFRPRFAEFYKYCTHHTTSAFTQH